MGFSNTHYWTPKFKMAEILHLEIHDIAISQRKIIRFWWNLVRNGTFGTQWQSRDQILFFLN